LIPQCRRGHANSSAQLHALKQGGLRFLLLSETTQHYNSGADEYEKQQLEKTLFYDIGRAGRVSDYQRRIADGPHFHHYGQN
jgi:hypothetical protein